MVESVRIRSRGWKVECLLVLRAGRVATEFADETESLLDDRVLDGVIAICGDTLASGGELDI